MKKLLPNFKPRGFTLIELMIAIAIIAVLAVIGAVIYGDVQKKGRDAKRKADVDSIAKTLEIQKSKGDLAAYPALATTHFAEGAFPTDPNRIYCETSVTTGTATKPTGVWTGNTAAACTAVGASDLPTTADAVSFWICATLEGTTNTLYCKGNQQ